jgi:hypothetical protein
MALRLPRHAGGQSTGRGFQLGAPFTLAGTGSDRPRWHPDHHPTEGSDDAASRTQ